MNINGLENYINHECKELKDFNALLIKKNNGNDDTEVSIIYDGKVWSIGVPYWDDEYDVFSTTYCPIIYCPYCSEKL